MVADRKRVKQVLRNAERKKRRLKEKARALTDDDLLAVMRLREERKQVFQEANDGGTNESVSIEERESETKNVAATLGEGQTERVDGGGGAGCQECNRPELSLYCTDHDCTSGLDELMEPAQFSGDLSRRCSAWATPQASVCTYAAPKC